MAKGGGGTQVQRVEPPAFQKPFLEHALGESARLYETFQPQFFPGSTVAPFAPETNLALTAQANRAMAGSPLNAAAGDLLQSTIRGDFLNSNPFLDATFDRAAGRIGANVASQFSQAGRYGSGAHQDVLQQGLGDLALNLYGGNFARERALQQQAAAMAPGLAREDYFDIGQLANVGAARQAQAQAELGDVINRFNFAQQSPLLNLQNYAALVSGNLGSTTSTSGGAGGSSLVSGLGGALTGAQLGGMLIPAAATATPWGAIGGAGLGLLGGLFG